MIVSFSLMRRRPDLSLDEFTAHWLDPHGPLTARIPGTQRYIQNHVVDGPGTNAAARALRLDGFPELAFTLAESRLAAHSSAEMAACNRDSLLFIGAVSRVITDDGDRSAPDASRGLIKQLVLGTGTQTSDAVTAALHGLETAAVISYRVLSQAGAPNSAVVHHGIEVATLHALWVDGSDTTARNAAKLAQQAPDLAVFQVDAHVFI